MRQILQITAFLGWLISLQATIDAQPMQVRQEPNIARSDSTSKTLGFTPLQLAIIDNDEALARSLIKKGADTREYGAVGPVGGNLLLLAVSNNKPWAIDLLAEAGYDLNQIVGQVRMKRTALHRAAERDYSDVVKRLLSKSANLTARDALGYTPLHVAAASNAIRSAVVLIQAGSNVNDVAFAGGTPLHVAAGISSADMVKLLLGKGAQPNSRTKESLLTPLHLLVSMGKWEKGMPAAIRSNIPSRVQTASLLIKAGADVNAKDERGWTPLHEAVQASRVDLAQLLLKNHADPQIKNNEGENAIDMATSANQQEMLSLLLGASTKAE